MKNINILDISVGVIINYIEESNVELTPYYFFYAYDTLTASLSVDNIVIDQSGLVLIDEPYYKYVTPIGADAATKLALITDILAS